LGVPCPNNGLGGIPATITGVNLPASVANADVKFGPQTAFVNTASSTSLSVTVPVSNASVPVCTGGNPAGTLTVVGTADVIVTDRFTGCTVTAAQAFQYLVPCTVAP
jgi:hypothetical protein